MEQSQKTDALFERAIDAKIYAPVRVTQPAQMPKNKAKGVPWDTDCWDVKMVRLGDPPRVAILVAFSTPDGAQRFLDELGTGLAFSDLPIE